MQESTAKTIPTVPAKKGKRKNIYEYSTLVKGIFKEPTKDALPTAEDLKKKFETSAYGAIESKIFLTLDKYKYLNKYNLSKVLEKELPDSRKRPNYDNVLSALVKDGFLGCYTLGTTHEKNTLYAYYNLPMVNEYMEKPPRILHKEDSLILERLSVNQWHIHTALLPAVSRAEYYPKYDEETEVYKLPSVLSIPLGMQKKHLFRNQKPPTAYLGAYPAPKGKMGEKQAMLYAKRLHNALSLLCKRKYSYDFGAIVLLCDSQKQMYRTASMLANFEELREDCILFALDAATVNTNPLHHLYLCEPKANHQYVTTKISFKRLAALKMK